MTDAPLQSATAFPTWDDATIEILGDYGDERDVRAGDELLRAGRRSEGFYVVLEGEVEVVRPDVECELPVGLLAPGQFVGGASLLRGQRPYLTARARTDGRVLAIPPDRFRDLMASHRQIATTIFDSTAARASRSDEAAETVRIIGSRFSPESLALRAFATRSRVPHTWIDLDDADDPDVVLASRGLRSGDVPAVVLPGVTLRNATPGALAERLGLTFEAPPGYTFDLVVVGGGPAGLAAAVYGAAEGLDTVTLDSIAAGGQAGTSTLIENYVGFPNGLSGGELTDRAASQARRLGARINAPCEVGQLRPGSTFHTLVLTDGSEIPTRSVIVASGAHYRRLALPELPRYEGAGVYYAATAIEARGCSEREVVVVGGGNSAGQAALFLADQGCQVSLVVRRDSLRETMSRYLVRRVEAHPNVHVRCETVVCGLEGERHLEHVQLEHTPTGRRRTEWCAGLFCFIGAEPATEWLEGAVALDDKGFVLTDRDLPEAIVDGPVFAARVPLPFETSVPGVFAVGDVRSGSLKRVAAAVGEGSSAVRSVYDHLSQV
ncbi:MAG TPA: FAD-dependent oxidoreductase [Acidimicrobiales bacterium]|nr:FAD-dependent oxidoreductase [Acidimicrobiales bacterium]